MAHQTYPLAWVEIDLPDYTMGDTRVKRKARLTEFHYTQSAQGITLTLLTEVVPFGANAQGLSAELRSALFRSYEVALHGDYDTLVNAATGDILAALPSWLTAEARAAKIATFEGVCDTQLQAEYFLKMRDTGTINMRAEWMRYMRTAAAVGRYD